VRKGGNLTVEAPPRAPSDTMASRMRTHVEGALSATSARVWVGPQVPGFVPLTDGTAELFLLDRVGDEFLAFYRDPYDAGSCTLAGDENCRYLARLYDLRGEVLWSLELGPLLSRKDDLEIQDIRYDDGVLFFNEACQSYSREAGGRCSALVAVDPRAAKVLWRSAPLTSNNTFALVGAWIVCGYGFTAERDFLYVVRRSDGKRVAKAPLAAAPEGIIIDDDGIVRVRVYPGDEVRFRLDIDGPKPGLVELR
jgi:hypothetical protein